MGCAIAIVFCCFGAAYGTAKSGVGICAMGVMRPELIIKSVLPVVMVFLILTRLVSLVFMELSLLYC